MDLSPNHPLIQNLRGLIREMNLNDTDKTFINKAFLDIHNNLRTRSCGVHITIIFPPLHHYYRYLLSIVAQMFALRTLELSNNASGTYSVLTTHPGTRKTHISQMIGNIAREQNNRRLHVVITEHHTTLTDDSLEIREISNTSNENNSSFNRRQLETILEVEEDVDVSEVSLEYNSNNQGEVRSPRSTIQTIHDTIAVEDIVTNTINDQEKPECVNRNSPSEPSTITTVVQTNENTHDIDSYETSSYVLEMEQIQNTSPTDVPPQCEFTKPFLETPVIEGDSQDVEQDEAIKPSYKISPTDEPPECELVEPTEETLLEIVSSTAENLDADSSNAEEDKKEEQVSMISFSDVLSEIVEFIANTSDVQDLESNVTIDDKNIEPVNTSTPIKVPSDCALEESMKINFKGVDSKKTKKDEE